MTSKKKIRKLRDVYQIKISLKGIRPPIWRRLEVFGDTTLEKLHLIFQLAMGWANYHLHQFTIEGEEYGLPDPDYDVEVQDERKVKLYQVVPREKYKFSYEYDFGDSWDHTVLVEKILPVEKEKRYPNCCKGKRACPPEDVGGVWGYTDFLETIKDVNHPDHEDMLEWVGGTFDPEEFDIKHINERLKQIS
jgi:hypothetical protein